MDKQPLVSVIVVCYNAAEYIVETLESVKAQTYKNIELIVSDDCSGDGTPEIIEKWMNKNKSIFVRTELITCDQNTGVSANYNRAVNACKGEWVKNVDGDDVLDKCCIQENVDFVLANIDAKLVFSNVKHFKGDNPKIIIREHFSEEDKSFFNLEAEAQLKRLLYSNILPSQSSFILLDLLKQYPYNEKYRGLEDEPMWINLIRNGNKAFYFDKTTAYYRKAESVTASSVRYYSPIYVESVFKFFWSEKVNYIKKYNLQESYLNQRRIMLLMELVDVLLHNRRSKIKNIIFRFLHWWVYNHVSFRL